MCKNAQNRAKIAKMPKIAQKRQKTLFKHMKDKTKKNSTAVKN